MLAASAVLLRYAPDSVKFGDANLAPLQKSVLLAGVAPILEAQPKGSTHVVLGL